MIKPSPAAAVSVGSLRPVKRLSHKRAAKSAARLFHGPLDRSPLKEKYKEIVTRKPGCKAKRRLHAEQRAEGVVLSVNDTGSGIFAEHLPHLSDRFYRVDSARGSSESTGLGLVVVKSIVELHGGSVRVASNVGVGSLFNLIFHQPQLIWRWKKCIEFSWVRVSHYPFAYRKRAHESIAPAPHPCALRDGSFKPTAIPFAMMDLGQSG